MRRAYGKPKRQGIARHVANVTLFPASADGTRGKDPLKKVILRHGCGLRDGEGDSETTSD